MKIPSYTSSTGIGGPGCDPSRSFTLSASCSDAHGNRTPFPLAWDDCKISLIGTRRFPGLVPPDFLTFGPARAAPKGLASPVPTCASTNGRARWCGGSSQWIDTGRSSGSWPKAAASGKIAQASQLGSPKGWRGERPIPGGRGSWTGPTRPPGSRLTRPGASESILIQESP